MRCAAVRAVSAMQSCQAPDRRFSVRVADHTLQVRFKTCCEVMNEATQLAADAQASAGGCVCKGGRRVRDGPAQKASDAFHIACCCQQTAKSLAMMQGKYGTHEQLIEGAAQRVLDSMNQDASFAKWVHMAGALHPRAACRCWLCAPAKSFCCPIRRLQLLKQEISKSIIQLGKAK